MAHTLFPPYRLSHASPARLALSPAFNRIGQRDSLVTLYRKVGRPLGAFFALPFKRFPLIASPDPLTRSDGTWKTANRCQRTFIVIHYLPFAFILILGISLNRAGREGKRACSSSAPPETRFFALDVLNDIAPRRVECYRRGDQAHFVLV